MPLLTYVGKHPHWTDDRVKKVYRRGVPTFHLSAMCTGLPSDVVPYDPAKHVTPERILVKLKRDLIHTTLFLTLLPHLRRKFPTCRFTVIGNVAFKSLFPSDVVLLDSYNPHEWLNAYRTFELQRPDGPEFSPLNLRAHPYWKMALRSFELYDLDEDGNISSAVSLRRAGTRSIVISLGETDASWPEVGQYLIQQATDAGYEVHKLDPYGNDELDETAELLRNAAFYIGCGPTKWNWLAAHLECPSMCFLESRPNPEYHSWQKAKDKDSYRYPPESFLLTDEGAYIKGQWHEHPTWHWARTNSTNDFSKVWGKIQELMGAKPILPPKAEPVGRTTIVDSDTQADLQPQSSISEQETGEGGVTGRLNHRGRRQRRRSVEVSDSGEGAGHEGGEDSSG